MSPNPATVGREPTTHRLDRWDIDAFMELTETDPAVVTQGPDAIDVWMEANGIEVNYVALPDLRLLPLT